MIKKTIAIFFVLIFLILKKIFIKENRIPNKTMDNFSNKLHSLFLFSSFITLYLLWFDIRINSFSLNTALYIMLFLNIVVIVRYFNPQMLISKETQVSILKKVNKVSLLLFISNWILFSFGFAFAFLLILLVNNLFYIFIISQINRQKQQEAFKQQFGEGTYSNEDIIKKHIINLFEKELEVETITKSDVKKQYRVMAKRYHPDVYKGDQKDKFVSINTSYKFLSDYIKE